MSAVRSSRLARSVPVPLLQREAPLGYLLLLPTLLLLGVFLLYPFVFGIYLSMTNAELGDIGSFVGLRNFSFEIFNDRVFQQSIVNTVAYTVVTTIFKLVLGLVMAVLLNQVFPAKRFVRAALLLPWIIPSVLSTLAWRWMFDPTFSVLNWAITHFGIGKVNWLGTTNTALMSLFIVNVWRGVPFFGISLLAGLQVIPQDMYEAARVDGATRWQAFANITLPMLRPVLLVVLLLSTILTFADLVLPLVLINGAPYNSTHVVGTWAFALGIPGSEIGLAAAVSVIMVPVFAVIIAATLISLRRPD